jgi:DnaJ-class molecular chaperone
MAVMADPYQTLGVSKTATDEEIRKAYRSLAKKHHPDLNPGNAEAERRFKEIAAAHSLLSDPEKRRAFDAGEIDESGTPKPERRFYREYADQGGGAFRYGSAEDMGDFADLGGFGDVFGDLLRRRGAGAGGGAQQQFRMRGSDAAYALPIDFLEAALGAKKRVDMPDGKTLDISIPAGVEEGQTLRLKGQGLPGVGGGPAGDALITLSIRPQEGFTREGNTIKSVLPITLGEALSGGTVPVETVTGTVNVKVPKGSNTGRVLRLRGKGVQGRVKGDHLVELRVSIPETPDADLERVIADWEREHPYNPRERGKASA